MNEQKITEVAEVLCGLKKHEWTHIKQSIDILFDRKSAKLQLDGSEELKSFISKNL